VIQQRRTDEAKRHTTKANNSHSPPQQVRSILFRH
jgi:hypothetical protein